MHISTEIERDEFIAGVRIDFRTAESGEIEFGDIDVRWVKMYNDNGDVIQIHSPACNVPAIVASRVQAEVSKALQGGPFYKRCRDLAADVAMFEASSPY